MDSKALGVTESNLDYLIKCIIYDIDIVLDLCLRFNIYILELDFIILLVK